MVVILDAHPRAVRQQTIVHQLNFNH